MWDGVHEIFLKRWESIDEITGFPMDDFDVKILKHDSDLNNVYFDPKSTVGCLLDVDMLSI